MGCSCADLETFHPALQRLCNGVGKRFAKRFHDLDGEGGKAEATELSHGVFGRLEFA